MLSQLLSFSTQRWNYIYGGRYRCLATLFYRCLAKYCENARTLNLWRALNSLNTPKSVAVLTPVKCRRKAISFSCFVGLILA